MRILVTENQYRKLSRRLSDFSRIDNRFKTKLRQESPCNYTGGFMDYFDYVSYRTEDMVITVLRGEGMMDVSRKDELELFSSVRKEIQKYIEDNLKEYAREYYNQYIKNNCPE